LYVVKNPVRVRSGLDEIDGEPKDQVAKHKELKQQSFPSGLSFFYTKKKEEKSSQKNDFTKRGGCV
jgi:hypothetical protein